MEDGQKTPRGHPDFHSYVKIQHVFIFQTSIWLTFFYFTLLALTDRQNYRWRNKYTHNAWAGGTFFPAVMLCQHLVLVAGNSFWFYILHIYVLRVRYSCGVVLVFLIWREIVFRVMYVLSVQYSCVVVSVFWLRREIVFKMITRFYKKIILGYFT
jgi:hypothetical protein